MHAPSHWKLQLPPEQLNWHVAFGWHQSEQSPPEQSTLQGTFGAQYARHLPLEQSMLHCFVDSQSSLQAPPEQSIEHACAPSHEPAHWPAEQLQLPCASQEIGFSALLAGRGSGSGGAELHATTTNAKTPETIHRMRENLC